MQQELVKELKKEEVVQIFSRKTKVKADLELVKISLILEALKFLSLRQRGV